jgi:hypothetical protein
MSTGRAMLALLFAAAAAAAQQPAPGDAPVRRRFDEIAIIVGDKAILASQVDREVQARLGSMKAQGTPITPELEADVRLAAARELMRHELLAHGTAGLDQATRERIDELTRRHVAEYQQEQIQKFGSFAEYSKQLDLLGQNWNAIADEQSSRARAQLHAQLEAYKRFGERMALTITPQQIRDYYHSHLEQFVRSGSADVEVIGIPPGPDEALQQSTARVVATRWAEPDADPAKLADEVGGTLNRQSGVRDSPEDPRARFIKEFAAGAQPGEISTPRRAPDGRTLLVLKLAARTDDRNDQLEDPAVQQRIVAILQREEYRRLEVELFLRSRRGTVIWPEELHYRR